MQGEPYIGKKLVTKFLTQTYDSFMGKLSLLRNFQTLQEALGTVLAVKLSMA